MAETWLAGSTCRLVSVPWDAGYKNVVAFDSPAERDSYLDALPEVAALSIQAQTYIRPNTPLTIDAPYSAVYGANYLVVDNPAQPVEGATDERLCYFVTDIQYSSPASTRLILQLDVWQTRFMQGGRLMRGYLERGHYPVARAWRDYQGGASLSDTLRKWCSAPEGLSIGTEYMSYNTLSAHFDQDPYICVMSTASLTEKPGSVTDPNLTASKGSMVGGLPSGAEVYYLSAGNAVFFYDQMAKYPWISQCIQACYYVPGECFDPQTLQCQKVNLFGDTGNVEMWASPQKGVYESTLLNSSFLDNMAPAINKYHEQYNWYIKLFSSPYTLLNLSTANGNSLIIKPELVEDLQSFRLQIIGCVVPPFMRYGIYVDGYNAAVASDSMSVSVKLFNGGRGSSVVGDGDWLNNALWLANLPQFSLTNNAYLQYLASTANTREYQYTAASMGLERSNAANRASYEMAQRSIATNAANQAVQNNLVNQQQMLGLASSGLSAIGSLGSLNVLGAASSVANGLLGYAGSQASQNASNAQFANNQALASANADTNQKLAAFMAESQYDQTIAGIQASVEDAEINSPTTSGQVGGEGFGLVTGMMAPLLTVKVMSEGAMNRVAGYFEQYGYAYQQWLQSDSGITLKVMNWLSYWKVLNPVIECTAANETEREAVRGIFESGVAIYANADDIIKKNTAYNRPLEV